MHRIFICLQAASNQTITNRLNIYYQLYWKGCKDYMYAFDLFTIYVHYIADNPSIHNTISALDECKVGKACTWYISIKGCSGTQLLRKTFKLCLVILRIYIIFISNSIFDPLSLRFSKIVATWQATVEPQIANS